MAPETEALMPGETSAAAAAPAMTEAGGSEKPAMTEAGGSEKPAMTEAGGSEKPAMTEAGGSGKPAMTEAGGSGKPATTEAGGSGKPATTEVGGSGKPAMVLGIDESEHSYYAMEWTIRHFFAPEQPQQYHLVVITAKPPASSVIGIAGIGTAELLPTVELDLKRTSARVIDKAKELCAHVIDVSYEVKEGDARNVLCDAVERHHADMLAMGSHGYGALKRAVLGSVSDYCTHHANCTVMIVKKPKHHKKQETWGLQKKL